MNILLFVSLDSLAKKISDSSLSRSIRDGAAFHHAGLNYEDRSLIERAFQSSELLVLCSTSTLALGVNLPAHLVIVKSTKFWSGAGSGWADYNSSDILQMTGRAGRPQFSSNGVAVVMCEESQQFRYQQLVSGQLPVESNFHPVIISHLNSEIVCGSVKSVEDALVWIRQTFLHTRIQKNPRHYGVTPTRGNQLGNEERDTLMTGWIQSDLTRLKEAKCLEWDEQFSRFKSMEKGKIMNQFYLQFKTVRKIITHK